MLFHGVAALQPGSMAKSRSPAMPAAEKVLRAEVFSYVFLSSAGFAKIAWCHRSAWRRRQPGRSGLAGAKWLRAADAG
jgi:hypothetical protein